MATSEKLDRVLLLGTFTAGKFENAAASSAYEEAFRGYGIDPTASDSAKTVELIRQSAIREQLITALDDWVFVYPRADYTGRERVLGLVKAADADNWQQQLRDPDTHKDKTKLEELSKDRRAATQPPSILVHLGKYLAQAGSWAASVDLLERAQRAYPADYWVNFGLATALYEGKSADTARAVGYFRAALAVRPLSRTAHLVLGRLLLIQRQSADAVTHLKRADELTSAGDPKAGVMLIYFGEKLIENGEFATASLFFTTAVQLLDSRHQFGPKASAMVITAERLVKLDAQLPTFLRGDAKPADVEDILTVATMCLQHRKLYAASYRFYVDAFANKPALLRDTQRMNWYNAACAAAAAGTGKGDDAVESDESTRTGMRAQALEWLREDLKFWAAMAKDNRPEVRAAAFQVVDHWKVDPDLQGVRDSSELAKLPPSEQEEFGRLWEKVNKFLASQPDTR